MFKSSHTYLAVDGAAVVTVVDGTATVVVDAGGDVSVKAAVVVVA